MENVAVTRSAGIDKSFWRGKRVLLTGHTGFKGSWLAIWLNRLGASVTGISLPPSTAPSLFALAGVGRECVNHFCDIRNAEQLATLVESTRPEVVIHLAAQALVRTSYREPLPTYATNVMGTVNLLDAVRRCPDTRVVLVATTDKVYRNQNRLTPYREDDELGGHDPYSASKAASEIIVASYRDAFLSAQEVALASVRAGNVMGGGDWSADRLIPDAIRAWEAGLTVAVRNPNAVRPWQHVLDPLRSYLALAQRLWAQPDLAGAYNVGPSSGEIWTVRQVIELARSTYGAGSALYGSETECPHETDLLTLDSGKLRETLGIRSKWNIRDTVERTIAWYRELNNSTEARVLCNLDLDLHEDSI